MKFLSVLRRAVFVLASPGICAAVLTAASPSALAAKVEHAPVTLAYLKSEHIAVQGKLVKAERIVDRAGEHILVVSIRVGPSSADNAEPNRDELFELFAALHTHKVNRWARTWLIEDWNDCPVIDSDASFYPKYITVTDLDKNGVAEVTVPYRMFCSGGIDSSDLKVIMRQGAQKFAMRGRTLTGTEVGSPYGGEMVFDKSLSLKRNAVFKAHLKFIRDKVYIEN